MKKNVLTEFQEYRRSNSLVHEKYIPFYRHWASKFLLFLRKNSELSHDLRVLKFINFLESNEKIADWQVRQADNAITLFVHHFLGRNKSVPPLYNAPKSESSKIVEDMRKALRIKHYAYSTERTYVDWARQFYAYMNKVKKQLAVQCIMH